jgi:spore maturation protein CgeB
MSARLRLVFLGLSLSSSWGNGHATTYRALLRALHERGHEILFLEREQPWYAANRDIGEPDYCKLAFYKDLDGLKRHARAIAGADAVTVGSYVPEGIAAARYVQDTARGITAFYDVDTPVTLAKLARGDFEYLSPVVIPGFDYYLSFSAGPALDRLRRTYGARRPVAFFCSAEPAPPAPALERPVYDLGYLGTYSDDRQPKLTILLLDVARALPKRRFVVAGSLYPAGIKWPENVERIEHIPPAGHAAFYRSCRFTLNVTRHDMVELGHSPSVRLFEAAALGAPIVSDDWAGLDAIFEPGREIVVARSTEDVCRVLTGMSEAQRLALARHARHRFLAEHTPAHRARLFESLIGETGRRRPATSVGAAL